MNRVTSPRRQRGQVLIAIFLASLLFGGAAAGLSALYDQVSIKRLHKAVKAQIQDPQRRQSLAMILDELDAAATSYSTSHARLASRLLEALERHETTRSAADQFLAELDALDRFSREALLQRRMQLREQLTVAEWNALFPIQPDADHPPASREAIPHSDLAPLQRRSLPYQVVSVQLR